MFRRATFNITPRNYKLHLLNASFIHSEQLVTPSLNEFPHFLKNIESKWKNKLMRRFERDRFVAAKEIGSCQKLPRYILSMFPYPSGRLHLGHVRIYTSGDILARYSKLMAKNGTQTDDSSQVIYPMGFDSFGLPAENAAKERNLSPAVWTNANIRSMKQQLDDLALQFDWREATSNPSYYKWTQDLFLKLMDSNLVYKSYAPVNWDPVDKTVLADEQVDEDGRSWRSGALVEKRNYRQWFIKVNAFTNDIYQAEDVDPETWRDILTIQRNWIGKPCGWLFYLPIQQKQSNQTDILPVFTNRPELFRRKDTKLLISSEHWLEKVYNISAQRHIINPFTNSLMEVELTNDTENLPPSCQATLVNYKVDPDNVKSDIDLTHHQLLLEAKLNGYGGYYTSDKYRDWLVSRQRFWGTPIPAIHCEDCGYSPVSKLNLPVILPKLESINDEVHECDSQNDRVIPPIEKLAKPDWLYVECPTCGSKAKRECETLDTLFDSSWYFLRYASDPLQDKPYDHDMVQPVWCYIGGKEHASMHLFYARFITHFLHSIKKVSFKEPFKKLLVQGVVKSLTYKLEGKYLTPLEYEASDLKDKINVDHEKMSKSKGNGVEPQALLDQYGIDATRFCLMSYTNPRTERLWRGHQEEFRDVLLYLRRVALTVQEYITVGRLLRNQDKSSPELKMKELSSSELDSKKKLLTDTRNRCAVEAIFHIQETNQFRQYISVLHALLTPLRSNLKNSLVYTREYAETLAALLVMLNPIAPHFSEELWLHFSKCIINPLTMAPDSPYKIDLQAGDQAWPIPDNDYPLQIKIQATSSDEYVERIPVSKDKLRSLSKTDISHMVESHFKSKGDECRVVEVRKYEDLMTIVLANLESYNRQKAAKKKKK